MVVERPDTSSTSTSQVTTTSPQHMWMPYSGPVQFTGPSGLRDYRANVQADQSKVGEGEQSREFTGNLSYLSRAPPNTSFPLAKNGRIGEIGWPVETFKIVKGI